MILNQQLNAGGLSEWLLSTRKALKHNIETDVPCGDCNACCRSYYFIHINPSETVTVSKIPEQLLFPAPGLPEGNVLMGYDEHGRCPMLVENQCSIYEHRPQTCRLYDCRIFAATGVHMDQKDKYRVETRVNRWEFDSSSEQDKISKTALVQVARFLQDHGDCFKPGELPGNATQLTIFAIKVYDVFLEDLDGIDNQEIAQRIIKKWDAFEAAANRKESS